MTSRLKKDSVWTGILIGLLLPTIVYGVLIALYTILDGMGALSDIGFAEDFRVRTLILFSICSNLIIMQRFRKSYQHETMRGILIASMLLIFIWFFTFGIKILKD